MTRPCLPVPWHRLLLVALLFAGGCTSPWQAAPTAGNSVSLHRSDLDAGRLLTEGWEARPGIDAALAAAQDSTGWRPVDIREQFAAQGFPDEGSVSYRLHLRLPYDQPVMGAVQHANNAYRLWAVLPDGRRELLAESGRPADDPREVVHQRRPAVFTFPAADMTLVWQISNARYPRGGPFYPLLVGSRFTVQRAVLRHVILVMLLVGFFAAIALAGLLLSMQDWRQPVTLALIPLALLAGTRTLVQSGVLEWFFPDSFSFDTRVLLEMGTFLLLPGGTALLLWTMMPWAFTALHLPWKRVPPLKVNPFGEEATLLRHPPPRWMQHVFTLAASAAFFFSLLLLVATLLSPTSVVGWLFNVALVAVVPLLLSLLIAAGLTLYVRHPQGLLLSSGFLTVVVAGSHDLLVGSGMTLHRHYWLGYGYFVFFVCFLIAFTLLKVRAKHQTEVANRELLTQLEARSREVQQTSQAARAAYLARSQFLTAVSHELRTPLAAIMGYAQLLQEEEPEGASPQHGEFLRAITDSSERLLQLIDDLLDLSRIDAGRFTLRPGPVSPNALMREVHTQLYPLAREKGLVFEFETSVPDDATILADGMRLRQVLINLASNALKFTREGAIRLTAEACTCDGKAAVRLRVADTGMGISPEFLPQLFDRFTQEARVYQHAQRGTGLGLHFSRELVLRMGGTIEVESSVNVGTVFTVTMPVHAPEPSPANS